MAVEMIVARGCASRCSRPVSDASPARRAGTLLGCAAQPRSVVLTTNIGDYDILLQLVPGGRALFYRSV
jgi:hypothetical protein